MTTGTRPAVGVSTTARVVHRRPHAPAQSRPPPPRRRASGRCPTTARTAPSEDLRPHWVPPTGAWHCRTLHCARSRCGSWLRPDGIGDRRPLGGGRPTPTAEPTASPITPPTSEVRRGLDPQEVPMSPTPRDSHGTLGGRAAQRSSRTSPTRRPGADRPGLGPRHLRRRPRRGLEHGRRGAGAPGQRGRSPGSTCCSSTPATTSPRRSARPPPTTATRPITLITLTPRQSVAEQDAAEGADLFARDPDRCCAMRKVEPLERGLAPYEAWVTGMRREDAPTRTDIEVVGWDARRGKVKINPLAAWTDEDVDGLRGAQRRPAEPAAPGRLRVDRLRALHEPTAPGDDPRAGRWAGRAKTECGLHT